MNMSAVFNLFHSSPSRYIPSIFLFIIPFLGLWGRDWFPMFASSATHRVLIVWLEIGFIASFVSFHIRSVPSLQSAIKSRLFLLFLLWQISAFVSVLFAPFPWPALIRYIEILSHCAFGWCLWKYFSIQPSSRKAGIFGIFIAFFYAVILCLILWYFLEIPQKYPWSYDLPLFSNIRHFGYFVAAVLPLGYLISLTEYEKRHVYICNFLMSFLILSVAWAVGFWLGGRGCLLSIFFVSIYMSWHIRSKWKTIIVIGLLSCFTGFFFAENYKMTQQSVLTRMPIVKEGNIDDSTNERLLIYKKSIQAAWEMNPWFGIGPDGFRFLRPRPLPVYVQPHGIIPQIFVEWGAIGSALFIVFVIASIRNWYKRGQNDVISALASMSVLALVLHSLIDGIFYHSYSLLIASYVVALSCGNSIVEKTAKKSRWSTLFLALIVPVMLLHGYVVYAQKEERPTKLSDYVIQIFPSYINTTLWIANESSSENIKKYIDIGEKYSDQPQRYSELYEMYRNK